MLSVVFRCLFELIVLVFVTIPVLILLVAALLYLTRCWIRHRSPSLLPHLRQPNEQGRVPLVLGFFHPYCNAGGGGERVLWEAIRALQKKYPDIRCVVYTGDTDADKETILQRATQRFNISLPRTDANSLEFVWLEKRPWVEAKPYPILTLLGQSFGSLMLGFEALYNFVPDIYLDTMGYAFTLPLFKYVGGCRVGCYVHYPTISTDMLQRVSNRTLSYNNASFISKSPVLSYMKLIYYRMFAYAYGMAGKCSDVIMVNSSWTRDHILELWQAYDRTHVVYPPCDTEEFLSIPLLENESTNTEHSVISIAQFRPEKDHELQLKAFHMFLSDLDPRLEDQEFRLVLVGSCRNEEDENRVATLMKQATELEIDDKVEFCLNVTFTELKERLGKASVGLHTMWNEHFGIGVVEMMAGGVVVLAHDSGGPRLDIVKEHEGTITGFLADSVDNYASALSQIFLLTSEKRLDICRNARNSVDRFSSENFEKSFLNVVDPIITRI